ncbi:hypothetical protein CFP56_043435 [Quercus suber]|uniref:Vesicle transport protein n=1 Tax=Quercus suber TaxID=58331 RepID=A0AAW0IR21_QUESU
MALLRRRSHPRSHPQQRRSSISPTLRPRQRSSDDDLTHDDGVARSHHAQPRSISPISPRGRRRSHPLPSPLCPPFTLPLSVLSIFDPKAAASARAQLDGVDEVDRQAHGEADVPGDDLDLEAQAQPPGLEANEQRKKDWNNAMLAFCMASSMAIALLPVQLHSQLQSSLPCLALALLLGFTSFFLSVFIHAKFVVAVRVLQKCGQFFTVTAFFLAISLRFSSFFKCTSWAVYFISFLGVVISSYFKD